MNLVSNKCMRYAPVALHCAPNAHLRTCTPAAATCTPAAAAHTLLMSEPRICHLINNSLTPLQNPQSIDSGLS